MSNKEDMPEVMPQAQEAVPPEAQGEAPVLETPLPETPDQPEEAQVKPARTRRPSSRKKAPAPAPEAEETEKPEEATETPKEKEAEKPEETEGEEAAAPEKKKPMRAKKARGTSKKTSEAKEPQEDNPQLASEAMDEPAADEPEQESSLPLSPSEEIPQAQAYEEDFYQYSFQEILGEEKPQAQGEEPAPEPAPEPEKEEPAPEKPKYSRKVRNGAQKPAPAPVKPEVPEEEKAAEAEPEEKEPAPKKPEEKKPEAKKPAAKKPEAKKAEAKKAEEKPQEPKTPEPKPEPKPEQKPAEQKPAEAKPAEQKPAEAKAAEPKPAEPKPAETKAAEPIQPLPIDEPLVLTAKPPAVYALAAEPLILNPLSPSQQRNFRLAGDVWILEQLCSRCGITEDLRKAFSGDFNQAANLLTLAIHGLLTSQSAERLPAWQAIERTPQILSLTPSVLRRTLQKVTPAQKKSYTQAQMARSAGQALVLSAYERPLGEKRRHALPWEGQEEEERLFGLLHTRRDLFPVAYLCAPAGEGDDALLGQMEKDYGTLPGSLFLSNLPEDPASMLGEFTLSGQSFLLRAEPTLVPVMEILKALSYADGIPTGMSFDTGRCLAYGKYALPPFAVALPEETIEVSDAFVCLFYHLEDRHRRLDALQAKIEAEEKLIEDLASQTLTVETVEELQEDLVYHKATLKGETVRFTRREKRIAREKAAAGYMALLTRDPSLSCEEALRLYKLFEKQEEALHSFPDSPKTLEHESSAWDFVRFLAYQMESALTHAWSHTELSGLYASPDQILDEMRSLRFVQYQNGESAFSEFTGPQKTILSALELLPEGEEIPKAAVKPAAYHRKKGPKRY